MEQNVYLTKDTLTRLARHYKAAVERTNQDEPYYDFAIAVLNVAIPDYRAAINEPDFVKNPAHAQVLVDYMLYLYEDCFRRNDVNFSQKDTDFLFKILLENDLVQANVQNQRAASILAAQVNGMVFNNVQWHRSVEGSSVHQFVERWAGISVAPEDLATVENTVRLLYGDTVWLLYGEDIQDKYILAQYLWAANLPMQPLFEKSAMFSDSAAEPPTDFN